MRYSTLTSGAHTTLRLSGFLPLSRVPLALTVYTDWMESFNGAAKDFIDSIIEDRQPELDGEFAKKTVQVALAIYEAARTESAAQPSAMV